MTGCNDTKPFENIIITQGLSGGSPGDESDKRFAIEVNNKQELFYCEEIMPKEGIYNYYYCKDKSIDFNALKDSFLREFQDTVRLPDAIADATIYNINYCLNGKKQNFIFYNNNYCLDSIQLTLFNNFLLLRNKKFEKIKYHNFFSKLLTEKMPPPPPLPSHPHF